MQQAILAATLRTRCLSLLQPSFRRTLATAVSGPAESISEHNNNATASTSTSSTSSSTSSPSSYASASRRAPKPLLPTPHNLAVSQTIHLPNFVIRLVRNGPSEKHNPYIATFRVPVQLTKPDIVSYLSQVYGLNVTSISTVVEMGEVVQRPPGGYITKRRKRATKKAIVGMEEPFWFPERRSEKWLNDNFEKDVRKEYLTRRILPVGDGGPGRGRRSWRWRGSDPQSQGVGARYNEVLKRIQEKRALQEGWVKRAAMAEREELGKSMAGLRVRDE